MNVLSLITSNVAIKDAESPLMEKGFALDVARKGDENGGSLHFDVREHWCAEHADYFAPSAAACLAKSQRL